MDLCDGGTSRISRPKPPGSAYDNKVRRNEQTTKQHCVTSCRPLRAQLSA
nr:MAG TPA: hypothetical protein [Bacteriophage sp.]